MTRTEVKKLNTLKAKFDYWECAGARDKAWCNLQDFAEQQGYGHRFCALEPALEWLMSSKNEDVRAKTLELHKAYCSASAAAKISLEMGSTMAGLGI